VKEEVREFSTLFGKKRLASFPFVILLFSLIIGSSLPVFDIDLRTAGNIYHFMIVLIGVQMGNIGFEARDRLDDVMGEGSRILYSSRTLPIREKTLVSVFLMKDAIFYSVVFLLPIVVGSTLGIAITPIESASVSSSSIGVLGAIYLYITTFVSFILGVSAGFFITTIDVKRRQGVVAIILLITSLSVAISQTNLKLSYLNSIGKPSLLVVMTMTSLVLSGIGILQFRLGSDSPLHKEYDSIYSRVSNKLSLKGKYSYVLVKTIMDIKRSAGGFWKIIFSTGTIVAAGFFLFSIVDQFFVTRGHPEIAMASLISLIAYPVYTVIFRYDNIKTYSHLPITDNEVYKSKAILYTIISIVAGTAFYIPVSYTQGGFDMMSVYGGIVLIGMLIYQLGILTMLVKDKPMQFLFDGMLFSGYSLSMIIFMVPAVVFGLYGVILPVQVLVGVLLMNAVAGIAGFTMSVAKIFGYDVAIKT
jgi:hypothetical protein